MANIDPNLGLTSGWAYRESGWKPGMDANLKKLGAVVQLAVVSIATTPPSSPANGDRHIIGVGTGAWLGKDDQIAVLVAGVWEYYTPEAGWLAWNSATASLYVYHSGSWQILASL